MDYDFIIRAAVRQWRKEPIYVSPEDRAIFAAGLAVAIVHAQAPKVAPDLTESAWPRLRPGAV